MENQGRDGLTYEKGASSRVKWIKHKWNAKWCNYLLLMLNLLVLLAENVSCVYFHTLSVGTEAVIQFGKPPIQQISTEVKL